MRSFYAAQLLKQYLIFLLTKRPVGFYIKTFVSCEGEITTSKSYQTLRISLEMLTPEDNSEKVVTEIEILAENKRHRFSLSPQLLECSLQHGSLYCLHYCIFIS